MGSLIQNTIFGRSKNSFVSTWRTSNTSSGSSTPTQIKLPLVASGTYNFTVDWGDGSSNKITAWNQAQVTHTYTAAGDYTIKINGTCIGWQFNNTGDKLKLLSIQSWGNLKLGNTSAQFYGCSNLNLASVSDILDLTGTTILTNCFATCSSLTTVNKLNDWDTSLVTSMIGMFLLCKSFNQNIGSWNTANVTNMAGMFTSAIAFNQPIGSWNTSLVTSMNGMFDGASIFNQNIGFWNVSNVTNMANMFRSATNFDQNIGAWDVSKVLSFSQFAMNTKFNNGGSSDINNWTINTSANVDMSNMFSTCTLFNQPLGNWNTSRVTNLGGMFYSATAFNQNISSWDVSSVTNFGSMFNTATTFNNGDSSDINNWIINTTSAVAMNSLFNGASSFNQPIGSWNVSSVTTFQQMFLNATSFNNGGSSNINNWSLNTTSDFNIAEMFWNASAFNQNIGSWNVSRATTFNQMFQNARAFNNGGSSSINNWTLRTTGTIVTNMFNGASSFNQPLGNWNVSGVTNMAGMFQYATVFNQNIGAWNTTNVTNMNLMFNGARDFNNGGSSTINNWNTGNVITTQRMFSKDNAANVVMTFNQPIGNWDMSKNTDMSYMFGAFQGTSPTSFNQDIGSWNVSSCSNFSGMFNLCFPFNNGGSPTINNWTLKTTGTINMSNMFCYATSFNQNIGSWNMSRVTNMSSMFYNANVFNNGSSPTINNWDTGNVTNMASMFFWLSGPIPTFNQPIGNWNTANVTNMNGMFGTNNGTYSSPFNQNIGAWNISNVTNFGGFMQNKKVANFSTANLDAIYNGWSSRPVKTPITITFGAAKYTSASSAGRALLTGSPNNWVITDGGVSA